VLYGGKAPAPEPLTPGFDVHIDASLDVFKYISATDSQLRLKDVGRGLRLLPVVYADQGC
jgi:hypothetical protein